MDDFYDQIEEKLTSGLTWKIGRNLDAFNDVLRGGFGVHDDEKDSLHIVWTYAKESRQALGDEMFDTILNIIRKHEVGENGELPSITLHLYEGAVDDAG